jgi:centractin
MKGENHQAIQEREYKLPDGNKIKLSVERTLAPEILFKPDLIGLEYPGVHEMVNTCI